LWRDIQQQNIKVEAPTFQKAILTWTNCLLFRSYLAEWSSTYGTLRHSIFSVSIDSITSSRGLCLSPKSHISASMTQVMIPLRTSEPSSSDSEDILAEVAHFEQGGRVLNDHYTSIEYAQRRLGHISRHPNYRNTLNIHLKVGRESDEVFGQHNNERLSVQSVRKRELTLNIDPLTPLPTSRNTATIDDYASYPPIEWKPGMPERWHESGKPSSLMDSNEMSTAPEQNTIDEKAGYPIVVQQGGHNASALQDDEKLKDIFESRDTVSTSASMTDKAQSSAPGTPHTFSVQIDKPSVSPVAPRDCTSGLPSPPALTTASSLYSRPLQSDVKSHRRSQRLSANTMSSNEPFPLWVRKVDCPPGVLKLPHRKARHTEKVKKDPKQRLPQFKALVGSEQGKPIAEKRVTFCIARADSPLDEGKSQKVSSSKITRPPVEEKVELSVSNERRRLKNLKKALQWTQGRSKPEAQGKNQLPATVLPNLAQQSNAEHCSEQSPLVDVPAQGGETMLVQQQSPLQLPTETAATNDKNKVMARERYLNEIAAGARLPRNRNDAIAASHQRYEQLFSQQTDQTRRSTQRLRRSSEILPRYPDMMPEFFSPANFQVRELKLAGTVRCICGATTDDTLRHPAAADGIIWIQCETPSCGVWQHVDCMGAAVPWIAQSTPHSRLTRRTTREAADAHTSDGGDALVASTKQLNSEVKYFCHCCDPWAHRQLLAEMRKTRPIVPEKGSGT
jgi:hypothetical protein